MSPETVFDRLPATEAAGPPGTMLFVSDDDYFRSTMRAYLEDEGFLVRGCADAARVPDLFFCGPGPGRSHRPDIDLLLIDVHALGATGLRLAAELTGFDPDLPVIVISAPDEGKNAWAAMARRGWKFLNKPVLLPQLLELIHCAMSARTARRGLKQTSPALREAEATRRAASGDGEGGIGCWPSLTSLLRLVKTQGTIQ